MGLKKAEGKLGQFAGTLWKTFDVAGGDSVHVWVYRAFIYKEFKYKEFKSESPVRAEDGRMFGIVKFLVFIVVIVVLVLVVLAVVR